MAGKERSLSRTQRRGRERIESRACPTRATRPGPLDLLFAFAALPEEGVVPSLSASELAAKGNEIVDAQNRFFDRLPCFMPLCPFERPKNRLYGTPLN